MQANPQSDRSLALKYENLPALYQATDTAAKQHQRLFIVSILVEAAFALIGALALVLELNPTFASQVQSVAGIEVGGSKIFPISLATGAALLATAATLGARYVWKPGEKWRESRYLGERCVTIAWRYATRATPADLGKSADGQADPNRWYLAEIDQLFVQAKPLDLPDVQGLDELTPAMSALRDAPLDQRFKTYLEGRAIDQRNWYDRRARQFRRRRNVWRGVILVIYILGALLLVAQSTPLSTAVPLGLLATNYWPLVVAAAGAVTGYVAARHYDDLQQSYRYMCERLSGEVAAMRASSLSGDGELADWVDRVETMLDAEHQQWHALS
jgi:hypothetical protein